MARSSDTTTKYGLQFSVVYMISTGFIVLSKDIELHYVSLSNLMSTTQYILRWVALIRGLSSSRPRAAWYLLGVT